MVVLQKYRLTLNIHYQEGVDGKIRIIGISSVNKRERLDVVPIINDHRKVLAQYVKSAIEKKIV